MLPKTVPVSMCMHGVPWRVSNCFTLGSLATYPVPPLCMLQCHAVTPTLRGVGSTLDFPSSPSKSLLNSNSLCSETLNKVLRLVQLGLPTDTLTPVCHTSRVGSSIVASVVVLFDLLIGERSRLSLLRPTVFDQSGTDSRSSREEGVFTGNTKVVS